MAPYRSVCRSTEDPKICYSLQRDIFQRYNDDENSIFSRSQKAKIKLLNQDNMLRQPSKTSESGYEPEGLSEDNSDVSPTTCLPTSGPPTPPIPPPPPPPSLNGGVLPTIRLKSEISERNEPPAKLQNAMMKDKKPFTYTPGGIDLSEIKSPRMQRRIVRNAQTPDDIILPPTNTSPVNANLLPPSTIAVMTPQMAIPVFPKNNKPLKKYNSGNQPLITDLQHKHDTSSPHKPNLPPSSAQKSDVPPPPHKSLNLQLSNATTEQNTSLQKTMTERQPTVSVSNKSNISVTNINETKHNVNATSQPSSKGHGNNMNRVGTLYIPPVTNVESNTNTIKQNSSPPTFPVLREAPTPWLQKHQQQSESVPAWANKNNGNDNKAKEKIYERKAQVTPVQTYKEPSNENIGNNGTHIIPIQIEDSIQSVSQQNQRSTSQRWRNNTEEDSDQSAKSHENIRNTSNIPNKNYSESESKPIQSRSFKVIQKITGSDDDSTSFNHHVSSTEGVPLNQLRKLQLNEDDQKFMNRVKAQVDDDTFLHTETDPRYRGAVIPSRAFRMLQNMTDTGQVTNTINVNNCPTSHTPVKENDASANHTHRNNSSVTAQPNRINSNIKAQERPNVTVCENETEKPSSKRAYIPPSERQAEQELRKYMGSSIPSRSFKMLQAMTATNDTSGRPDESDF